MSEPSAATMRTQLITTGILEAPSSLAAAAAAAADMAAGGAPVITIGRLQGRRVSYCIITEGRMISSRK